MRESISLTIIQQYFENHKFKVSRLVTTNLAKGKKSPDFTVSKNNKLSFICELKSPDLVQNSTTKMFHWTTTVSKLRDHIHKSTKQFKDFDTRHSNPWVLVFLSDNFQLNWTSMTHCIRGSVSFGGDLLNNMQNKRFITNTETDLEQIDLIIWGQVNSKSSKIYQLVPFCNFNSVYKQQIDSIWKELIPYASEDIVDLNTKKYNSL